MYPHPSPFPIRRSLYSRPGPIVSTFVEITRLGEQQFHRIPAEIGAEERFHGRGWMEIWKTGHQGLGSPSTDDDILTLPHAALICIRSFAVIKSIAAARQLPSQPAQRSTSIFSRRGWRMRVITISWSLSRKAPQFPEDKSGRHESKGVLRR